MTNDAIFSTMSSGSYALTAALLGVPTRRKQARRSAADRHVNVLPGQQHRLAKMALELSSRYCRTAKDAWRRCGATSPPRRTKHTCGTCVFGAYQEYSPELPGPENADENTSRPSPSAVNDCKNDPSHPGIDTPTVRLVLGVLRHRASPAAKLR